MYGTITLDVVQLLVIYFSAPLGVFQMVINYVITCFVWFFVWFHFVKRYTGVRLIEVLVRDVMPFLCITLIAIGAAYLITLPLANIYLRILSAGGAKQTMTTENFVAIAALFGLTLPEKFLKD